MNNFLGLCTAEWRKLRGRGLLATVLLLAGLHGLVSLALLAGGDWLSKKAAGEDAKDSIDFLVGGEVALDLVHSPLMGLALMLTFSILWAEDFSLGTIAAIFSRPASRASVFLAKAATGAGLTLVAYLLALGIGLITGLFFGTHGEIDQLKGSMFVGWMADTPAHWPRVGRLLLAIPMLLLEAAPMLAAAALLASLTRSAVMTLFGGILLFLGDTGLTLALKLWSSMDLRGAARAKEALEWTMMSSRELYALHDGGASLAAGAGDSLRTVAYTVLFLGLAWPLFSRRDVQ